MTPDGQRRSSPQLARQAERTRALYDAWSAVFLRCAGATHQTVLLPVGMTPSATNREMAQRAGLGAARRLLDAGCGVGGPACDAALQHQGLGVDAVTLSPVQAELARGVVRTAGLADRVRIHTADYHQLPFDAATFDAIWMLESACYSARPAQLLSELARVADDGARLYIKDLFLADRAPATAEKRDLRRLRKLWALPRLWTLARWAHWAKRAGWHIVDASELVDASNQWYTGAMFEFTAAGLRLNEFGRQFAVSMPDVPIVWGQLVARRVSRSARSRARSQ